MLKKECIRIPTGFHAAFSTPVFDDVDRTFHHDEKAYAPFRHGMMFFEPLAKKLDGRYVPHPEGADHIIRPNGIEFTFEQRLFMVLFSQPNDRSRPTVICAEEGIPGYQTEKAARHFALAFQEELKDPYNQREPEQTEQAFA